MKRNNVKQITIRLTADEYAHVKQLSKDSGLKMEPAIRRLIMGVNLRPRPPDELPELLRQLSGIGTNINQIAKVANASGYVRKEDMEGAVIVLACIIFSAFSSSGTPVVDSSASVVTQVWSYLGEVIFNLLVLVGLVKSADHIAKEMLGL